MVYKKIYSFELGVKLGFLTENFRVFLRIYAIKACVS